MMSAVPAEGVQLMAQHAHFDRLPPRELHLTCIPLPVARQAKRLKGHITLQNAGGTLKAMLAKEPFESSQDEASECLD